MRNICVTASTRRSGSRNTNDYSAARTNRYTDEADIALMARWASTMSVLSIDAAPLEGFYGAEGLNSEFIGGSTRPSMRCWRKAGGDDRCASGEQLQGESPHHQRRRGPFTTLWRRLAAHYATRDPERVFFEIMNEPEVNDPYRWAGIQARVAAAIREVAPKNTIIATGPNYSDIQDLLTQHPLEDGNVIYNFHFYDPHEFTHQGAGWGSHGGLPHEIPYPASEDRCRSRSPRFPIQRIGIALERYWLDHWDAHQIRLPIDAAAAWGKRTRRAADLQ